MSRMQTEELKRDIKQKLIIDRLKLEEITVDEIEDAEPLFEEGLGLDSVEAFEIIVGMEQLYGVKVEELAADELKTHMYSVNTLTQFIESEMDNNEA